MSRPRREVVAEIETLLAELADIEIPEDRGEGWSLTDFLVIELWSRINDEAEIDEAVTVTHRQRRMPNWRSQGLLAAATDEVLFEPDDN